MNDRFKELILYICKRSEGDDRFGATKLNKLLFFSDLEAYVSLGRSITGQDYQKLDQGPAPRRLLPVMDEMRARGEVITEERVDNWGYVQHKTIALREPNTAIFSTEEIAIVDRLIEHFWGKSAKEVSSLSHNFIGWQLAEDGETIPFEAVFVAIRPLTQEERALALQSLSQEGFAPAHA